MKTFTVKEISNLKDEICGNNGCDFGCPINDYKVAMGFNDMSCELALLNAVITGHIGLDGEPVSASNPVQNAQLIPIVKG